MHLHVHGFAPDGTPAHKFEVYLDGERLDRCFEADDERGYALCYATDENGRILLDESGESPKVVERRGKIEFRLKTA